MPVSRKRLRWRKRWSAGLMIAAGRTTRPRLRWEWQVFLLSSFYSHKEVNYESTGIGCHWRTRAASGDPRALGDSRGTAVRARRDLRAGALDRGEGPRSLPGAPPHLTHEQSRPADRHAHGAAARGDYAR